MEAVPKANSDAPSRLESPGISSDPAPLKWFPGNESDEWFHEHYEEAARHVVDFFGGDNISLTGQRVADIGCGDGIIDLGVMHKAQPSSLVGFDLRPTDADLLRTLGRQYEVLKELPQGLEFRACGKTSLPAPDDHFDFVFSWSAFEHAADPAGLLKEVRRILRKEGVLMIQLYPFFHSQHGSHLWPWYPEGFAQFLHTTDELLRRVRSDPGADPDWTEALVWDFQNLNQITLDSLQTALKDAGFIVVKLDVLTETVRIPPEVSTRLPLSLLGTAGVKLLAVPA